MDDLQRKIYLVRTMLKDVKRQDFHGRFEASENWKLGDSWEDDGTFSVSREDLLSMIAYAVCRPRIFKVLGIQPISVVKKIREYAMRNANGGGMPYASVNNMVPVELKNLAEQILQLEGAPAPDPKMITEVQQCLASLRAGEYTFSFTIKGADGWSEYSNDACEPIPLTARELRAVLISGVSHKLQKKLLISGLPVWEGNLEELIEGKAAGRNFAINYDYHSYYGSSPELKAYVWARARAIRRALARHE